MGSVVSDKYLLKDVPKLPRNLVLLFFHCRKIPIIFILICIEFTTMYKINVCIVYSTARVPIIWSELSFQSILFVYD